VLAADTTLTVEFSDGETRAIRRTTTQPVRSIKGQRPRTAANNSQAMCRTSAVGYASHISRRITHADGFVHGLLIGSNLIEAGLIRYPLQVLSALRSPASLPSRLTASGLDRAVKPVPSRAPDSHAFQRPVS
jgi:hypothetical protein